MKLRIMTWNVLYSEKTENILPLIKKLNPDIFCGQELAQDNTVKEIAKLFSHYYFEPARILSLKGNQLNLGNGIFTKFPIRSQKKVYVWDGINLASANKQEQRIYVECQLDLDKRKIIIGTTHLSFNPGFKMTLGKRKEANILIEAIKKHKSGFIAMGDFNAGPSSYTIREVEKYFKSAGPSHKQNTFTTKPFSFMGFEVWGLDWRLDYIFTTKDIKVLSSQIINTEFSDHLPIVAEIQI